MHRTPSILPPRNAKYNERETKTGFVRVFKFQLGRFVAGKVKFRISAHTLLELKARSRFSGDKSSFHQLLSSLLLWDVLSQSDIKFPRTTFTRPKLLKLFLDNKKTFLKMIW